MNKTLAIELIICGALIALLALFDHLIAPEFARTAFVTGLIGGVLSILWGLFGLLGYRKRVWAILTLIIVSYVFLSQAITGWFGQSAEKTGIRTAAAIVTVMFFISLATLMILAYAGISKPIGGELQSNKTLPLKKAV